MKPIIELSLRQCELCVYDTEKAFLGERLYSVVTIMRCYGTRNVRFGNRQQVRTILNSYRASEQADAFWEATEDRASNPQKTS